jgi:hypothetical protein
VRFGAFTRGCLFSLSMGVISHHSARACSRVSVCALEARNAEGLRQQQSISASQAAGLSVLVLLSVPLACSCRIAFRAGGPTLHYTVVYCVGRGGGGWVSGWCRSSGGILTCQLEEVQLVLRSCVERVVPVRATRSAGRGRWRSVEDAARRSKPAAHCLHAIHPPPTTLFFFGDLPPMHATCMQVACSNRRN